MLRERAAAPSQRDERPLKGKLKKWRGPEGCPAEQHLFINSPTGTAACVCEDRSLSGRGGPLRDEEITPIEVTTVCLGVMEEWADRKDAEMHFLRELMGARDEDKTRYLKVYNEIRQGLSVCADKIW